MAAAGPAADGEGAATGPRPPVVVIGEGRRPEAATRVAVAEFDGPLGLLLNLIESRRLEVLTVPLGDLAGAYLDAIAGLEADRIGNISAFVAVASQLILIKSRAMLPRRAPDAPAGMADDAPDPEAELRARLLVYRAHRDAGVRLQAEAAVRIGLFRREPRAAHAAAVAGARHPELRPLDPAILAGALDGLLRVAPPPAVPPEVVRRVVTLAERARVVRAALADADWVVLQDLVRGISDRVVVVVTFLAFLELSKRREIVVEQAEPFGPIRARRTSPEEREAAGLPPEVEVGTIDESLRDFA